MTDFEKLFNENREFIFKYLMKMTRDITLSEELTQETFFRAYMNYASLRNKEKASVWLCQIARNTYFAWYNEQKKKDSLDDLEVASNITKKNIKCVLNAFFCSFLHDHYSFVIRNLMLKTSCTSAETFQ